MERYCWKAFVVEGMQREYIKRHDEIWPEMKQVLKDAGICNYSIWLDGNQLIGYYECEKGIEYAKMVQNQSPVVAKWNEYMKDILIMQMQEDGGQPQLQEVFYLK